MVEVCGVPLATTLTFTGQRHTLKIPGKKLSSSAEAVSDEQIWSGGDIKQLVFPTKVAE